MSDQSIEETQRRLQLRKRDRRDFKKYLNPQTHFQRSKSSPDQETKSYARPGKLYLRSLDPQSRKNYYTIDTDMSRVGANKRIHRKEKSYQKLPPIKKMRLVRVGASDRKFSRNQTYMSPTASSRRLHERKKGMNQINDNKRICSVNCNGGYEKNRINRSERYGRKRLHSGHSLSRIDEYLSNEARSRYPQTQLRSYLTRMKQKDEDYQVYRMEEDIQYTTYFGLQPQFWRLKTQYVEQMYEQAKAISSIQNYKPYVLPFIPERQAIAEFIQTYKSFGKEINIQKLIHQPNFLVQYTPTELYFGQMESDEREGLGVLICQKSCFEGLFRANEKAKGVEVTASGMYRGEFYHNKKDGNGQFQWINGEHYIGQWREGHRHGKGVWNNNKGDSYNGEWVRGRGQGYGIYLSEGRQYHGDFVDFKKDGWGRQKLPNGDYYQGGFQEGLPEGKGTYTWRNGTKYEGQFSHGFRNGKGILSTLDGYSYNGEFIDEKPQGLCEMLMPNGDIYQGYLRNGKKNGRGTLIFAKNRKNLDGYWQNDRFLGRVAS